MAATPPQTYNCNQIFVLLTQLELMNPFCWWGEMGVRVREKVN